MLSARVSDVYRVYIVNINSFLKSTMVNDAMLSIHRSYFHGNFMLRLCGAMCCDGRVVDFIDKNTENYRSLSLVDSDPLTGIRETLRQVCHLK